MYKNYKTTKYLPLALENLNASYHTKFHQILSINVVLSPQIGKVVESVKIPRLPLPLNHFYVETWKIPKGNFNMSG